MTYFHTTNPLVIATLAEAITSAMVDDRAVRIDVDENGFLKFKIGEGMWSAPFYGTDDPYRDHVLTNDEQSRMCIPSTIGGI